MARIVTTTYRYKPPPKRKGRKLAEIIGSAVVIAKGGRRPGPLRGGQAAAEVRERRQGVGQADDNQAPPTLRASITSRPTMIASRRSCWPAASWRRC